VAVGLGAVEIFFILVVVALVVYVLWRLLSVHAARLHAVGTSQGVPIKVIQEVLGHSSIAVTMDVYSHHVLPDMQQQAASAMDSLRKREPFDVYTSFFFSVATVHRTPSCSGAHAPLRSSVGSPTHLMS
jgi:hypothetical protein